MRAAAIVLCGALAGPATAIEVVVSRAPVYFADRVLVNANSEPVPFKGGIIGAGPAIISFTFTGCETICPISEVVMQALEAKAEEETHLQLVTITIDPMTDTPERLRRHAIEVGSTRREWLTGDPQAVFDVLNGLGMQFGDLSQHPLFFVVVDADGSRAEVLAEGDASPDKLLAAVNGLD